MSLKQQASCAAFLGVSSHLAVFIRGEHHLYVSQIFYLYTSAFALLYGTEIMLFAGTSRKAQVATLAVSLSYILALFSSILVYRLLFHPLRKFPGPYGAKVSKFWNVAKAMKSTNYKVMESLHQSYGDFVRTGPNEISIFQAEAVRVLDGPGTKCSKSAWYDIMQPRVSVATTRDLVQHHRRRKAWERAFNSAALRDYDHRLEIFARQLQENICQSGERPLNVSKLFYLYAFDVMSDLAFGEPLNMLQSTENHFTVKLLQDGMDLLGPLSPVPWLVRLGFAVPGVARSFKRLLAWSARKLQYRMQHEPAKPDVLHHLLQASYQNGTVKEDQHWLRGDAFALIVAGSDTVASTMISIFYHLAEDPSQVSKLRAELESVSDAFSSGAIRNMPHLNGIINEVLRLHPALPSGGLRQTPPQGIMVSGQFIPGNVVVSAPRYSLGRLESCYERPGDFVPERWYSKSEMVKKDIGFAPFSVGRYNCIGKPLALNQLQTVVSFLISEFDVTFAPNMDRETVWRDLKDQFNSHPGNLHLVFSKRKVEH